MVDVAKVGLAVDSSKGVKGVEVLERSFKGLSNTIDKEVKRSQEFFKGFVSGLFDVRTVIAGIIGGISFSKIIEQGAAFKASLTDLSAITGATGKDLEFLSEKAQEFGRQTTLSASGAAEAFKLIASAKPDLLDNADALVEVTKQAVALAEASGVDLPEAADILGTALNQMGANADEAARIINVLAASAKYGASEIPQTAEAIRNAGVSAASAGVGFEEFNAAIQVLAANALKGSEAGTQLRNIFLKLDTSTKDELRPSVVGLANAIRNLGKENLSTQELVKQFNLENINGIQILLKSADALDRLTKQVTGTGVAYEQQSVRVNNLKGDINSLGSALEGLGILIQDSLDPYLRSMTQSLTSFVNAISDNIGDIKNWAQTLFEAGAAIGGMLILKNVIPLVIGFGAQVITVTKAWGAFNAVLAVTIPLLRSLAALFTTLLSPIGLVTAAISAVSFAVIKFRHDQRELNDTVDQSGRVLKDYEQALKAYNRAGANATDEIKNQVAETKKLVEIRLKDAEAALEQVVSNNKVKTNLTGLIETTKTFWKVLLSNPFDSENIAKKLVEGMGNVTTSVVKANDAVKQQRDRIKELRAQLEDLPKKVAIDIKLERDKKAGQDIKKQIEEATGSGTAVKDPFEGFKKSLAQAREAVKQLGPDIEGAFLAASTRAPDFNSVAKAVLDAQESIKQIKILSANGLIFPEDEVNRINQVKDQLVNTLTDLATGEQKLKLQAEEREHTRQTELRLLSDIKSLEEGLKTPIEQANEERAKTLELYIQSNKVLGGLGLSLDDLKARWIQIRENVDASQNSTASLAAEFQNLSASLEPERYERIKEALIYDPSGLQDIVSSLKEQKEQIAQINNLKTLGIVTDEQAAVMIDNLKNKTAELSQLGNDFALQISSGIADAAINGKDFIGTLEDIGKGLAKAVLQALLLKAATAAIGGLSGIPGFGFLGGGAGGAQTGGIYNIPKFQGGGLLIPSSGGIDDKLLQLRVNSGEQVKVIPNTQSLERQAVPPAIVNAPITINAIDAQSFNQRLAESQAMIIGTLEQALNRRGKSLMR